MEDHSLIDTELSLLLSHTPPLLALPSPHPPHSYIQPASIDLPLSAECYLVKDRMLPHNRLLRDLLPSLRLLPVDLSHDGAVLLKGQTYLAYCGVVSMPEDCRGSLSPKSSIGRVDMMVRGVFDGCGLYDTIDAGQTGELWMEISPKSFNVKAKEGSALSQMMVFKKGEKRDRMGWPALLFEGKGVPVERVHCHHDGSIVLSIGLSREEEEEEGSSQESLIDRHEDHMDNMPTPKKRARKTHILGWEALPTNEIIDLSKVNAHDPTLFFKPIFSSSAGSGSMRDRVTLEKDKFYILATKERISVPTFLSAEMVPFSHHIGELRAHYAGFFDPGFGYGKAGEIHGTIGVLEVRPHETMTIFDGQPIALMVFFQNTQEPKVSYGQAGNSYQNQRGPKLAKYFIS